MKFLVFVTPPSIYHIEYLPYKIWYEYFLESQGYATKSNILWKDNEAADKKANKEKKSLSSKSRNVGIKLFWVADRVKQVNIRFMHCLTDKMLASFFTKTLQGIEFSMFIRVIMGWDNVATL